MNRDNNYLGGLEMKEVDIQDLKPGLVSGIDVQLPCAADTYKERYFEWTATSVIAKMKTNEISGGVLRAWHHVPFFYEIETHIDAEMFYFISGVALMLFIDLKNGKPDTETAQIVRIRPGTQLSVPAGKGHFVPVAEESEPICVIVVAPKMDAPRIPLSEPVKGA
jgi:mannose-6-phosphate isomerase-like protein (cupin superfamily)